MTQLAKTEDFTAKATQEEMLQCLTLLSSLPSRASADDQVNIAGFYMALEGVTRHGLQTATKQIMQGSLGHAFLPSPPELRQECDKVMKPILEARAWDAHDRKIREEMAADRKRASDKDVRDEAFYERGRKRMEAFHAAMKTDEEKAQENTYDAAMARLQALAEANGKEFNIDKVPSAPSGSFIQAGKAA